jgi:hypothetical protein
MHQDASVSSQPKLEKHRELYHAIMDIISCLDDLKLLYCKVIGQETPVDSHLNPKETDPSLSELLSNMPIELKNIRMEFKETIEKINLSLF